MTVHNGKGLEFTVTFLAGMEEGLFPYINKQYNKSGNYEVYTDTIISGGFYSSATDRNKVTIR
jgi:superfamily I DNA/RNA helicase